MCWRPSPGRLPPPTTTPARRPPPLRARAPLQRTAAAPAQQPPLLLEGGEALEYGGLCTSCGQQHHLRPTPAALQAAAALVQQLDATGRIDFDAEAADPRFSTEYVWTKGPGRMLGVMVCSDSQVGSSAVGSCARLARRPGLAGVRRVHARAAAPGPGCMPPPLPSACRGARCCSRPSLGS
jgi:hypothetical protein